MRAMSRTSAGVGASSWQKRHFVLSVSGLVFAAAFVFLLHGHTLLQAVPGRPNNAAHAPGAPSLKHMASEHALRPSTVTEHGRAAAPKIQTVTISPSVPLPECICYCPLAIWYVSRIFHAAQQLSVRSRRLKTHFMA